MKESYIEKKSVLFAKSNGFLTFKFNSMFRNGVPDRVFIKNGVVFFVEFKAPNKKTTPLQNKIINDLLQQKIKVFIVDNIDYFKEIIKNIL